MCVFLVWKLERDWWYSLESSAENEEEKEKVKKFMGSSDPHGGHGAWGECWPCVHGTKRAWEREW